jgi:hypothetical protein
MLNTLYSMYCFKACPEEDLVVQQIFPRHSHVVDNFLALGFMNKQTSTHPCLSVECILDDRLRT